ncbi:MAG: hypothetical protein ACJAVV_000467 [Alphaproteobacteria bacterium]|jgi:hypothetical protein
MANDLMPLAKTRLTGHANFVNLWPMHAEKPIFIIAAPRSGSTLLFETLMRHQQLWSFGDEGHAWIEKYPNLRPVRGGVASNRLTGADINEALAEQLKLDMLQGMISAQGERVNTNTGAIRLLEKTPKNCLRIPFIDTIYPDAHYIYLYRDPKDSISSIIEGWRHQRFVTYGDVRMEHGRWCFLRPPAWQEMLRRPLNEIAAFQWQTCQDIILDDLAAIERQRWTLCAFDEFLDDPKGTISRLQNFCELDSDSALEKHCSSELPLSKYTQTAPANGKWMQHGAALAQVFSSLIPTINRINTFAADTWRLDTTMPPAIENPSVSKQGKTSRNDLCPCGSGRKYKMCHGQLA